MQLMRVPARRKANVQARHDAKDCYENFSCRACRSFVAGAVGLVALFAKVRPPKRLDIIGITLFHFGAQCRILSASADAYFRGICRRVGYRVFAIFSSAGCALVDISGIVFYLMN